MELDPDMLVASAQALETLYGPPGERVLLKQVDRLDAHCRAFIAASPLCVLATCGRSGADCSPRGDAPGFVQVADDRTLLLPDRRGNNRLDSLRNIIDNPAVALLFLVPGVDETFRVNGEARISRDPALCARFAVDGRAPATVLVVGVREAFIQCARALRRSRLWDGARHLPRTALPSTGEVLAAHTGGKVDAADYDAALEQTLRRTLY